MYNSIPAEITPPLRIALLHYPDAFDLAMAYQLRERNPATLEDMQSNVVSVDANLLEKKSKMKIERKVTMKEKPTTSFDAMLDNLVNTMEDMLENIALSDSVGVREP